ncbi:MAG: DNA polymerase III subunit delta [Clostridia bacterium]|nr:DNA polymerase III subunit delta [Clostridia bacterium]NCC43424.1 DNA polymerase III subunit delta [Clostridia bacterium]
MRSVLEDIKNQQFKKTYLFYGQETYLKKQYRDKLIQALNPEDDTMNYTRMEGKNIDPREVISLGETMPFFADRRIIVLENSGFFKKTSPELSDYIGELPDYLCLIFVEEEVDKRNKLFKAVGKAGREVEFKEQNEQLLMRWILGTLKKEEKKITQRNMELLLAKTGTDMSNIEAELEKLMCYTMGREEITTEDIEAICSEQINGQIFAMVQAVSEQRQKKALSLYYDLLALKEPPLRILNLLARQFNILLQVKELYNLGYRNKDLAAKAGVSSYFLKDYTGCIGRYTVEQLREAVEECTRTEEDVKSGRMGDVLSVELLIVKYASKQNMNY